MHASCHVKKQKRERVRETESVRVRESVRERETQWGSATDKLV
jgi:hypothetical protein